MNAQRQSYADQWASFFATGERANLSVQETQEASAFRNSCANLPTRPANLDVQPITLTNWLSKLGF